MLSSLFGLAFAGGVTWGVRLSASAGLGVEALGFGDVTLMAMIGTYLGWQPSLLVFFIAPLVAILFVLLHVITGDTATPYGPYLCAAAAIVLVYWHELWTEWAARMFTFGACDSGNCGGLCRIDGSHAVDLAIDKTRPGFGGTLNQRLLELGLTAVTSPGMDSERLAHRRQGRS